MRPDWDNYFLEIAHVVKTRSTCIRRQVGAVIVKDHRIISTGYNGAASGAPHCDKVGCIRNKLGIKSGERHELCIAIHAEQNAIVHAAKYGTSIQGATLYCTHQPCAICAKMLVNAGIQRIVFSGAYPDEFAEKILNEGQIEICKLYLGKNCPDYDPVEEKGV